MKSDETRSPAVLMGDLNVDARHYHPMFSHHKTTPGSYNDDALTHRLCDSVYSNDLLLSLQPSGDNKGINSEPYKVMVEMIKTSCSKAMKPTTPNPFDQDQSQVGELTTADTKVIICH